MKRAILIIITILLALTTCGTAALAAPEGFTMLMTDSEGIDVIRIQMRLRDLGYITYRATGMYYTMTQNAVQDFQENNELDPDGRCGEMTYDKLFEETGLVRKPLSVEVVVPSGPSLDGEPPAGYGELSDWASEIDAAFPVGDTVTVTDFNTGDSFQMKRTGGTNHADVEPIDAAAYQTYIDSFGGVANWEKRSVLVTIGDKTYAASLFGNSYGDESVEDNTMAGHTCLYFNGSTSDVLGFVDKEHQKFILRAAGEL